MRSSSLLVALVANLFAVACGTTPVGPDGAVNDTGASDSGSSCYADASVPAAIEGGVTVGNERVGDDGRLTFHIVSGEIFVNYPWRPLLAGTREELSASRTDLVPHLSVTSSMPLVATATVVITRECCTTDADGGRSCEGLPEAPPDCRMCAGSISSIVSVAVRALSSGDTVLTLRTDDGARFDAVPVSVRAASTLQIFRANMAAPASVTVPVDESVQLSARAFDATMMQLQARYGITVTSSNPDVVRVRTARQILEPFVTSVESYDVLARGMRAGNATLTFHASNADAIVNVTVQ